MPTNINRPSTYGTSNISRSRLATIRRQDEALRLRRSGMTYVEIARQLGFTPNGVARPQSAAEAVRAAERRQRIANSNTAVQTVANATAITTDGLSTRTFGFEAEFFNITPSVALRALADVGITASFEGYTHRNVHIWKCVTDASVTRTGTGEGAGLELVSPILRGRDGLEWAAKALDALRGAGAKIDRTCGMHVHVGMDGLTGMEMMKIVDTYVANQTNINRIVSRSRHNNDYCLPFNEVHAPSTQYRPNNYEALRGANTATATTRLSGVLSSAPRYRVVNLTSYGKYGTLEFRQHQGTLNGKKGTAWIEFLLGLVETSVASNPVNAYASVYEMITALGVSNTTARYLVRRESQLNPEPMVVA